MVRRSSIRRSMTRVSSRIGVRCAGSAGRRRRGSPRGCR
jgi:hypothetical protein